MQTIGFNQAVEKVVARDPRYHREAYAFLRDALDATLKKRKKARKDTSSHVSPGELLEGLRLHALQEFGPMTITVLDYWGIHSCEDFGHMVFNLVEVEDLEKNDQDSIEDFRGGFDFVEAFAVPFRPSAPAQTPAPGFRS